MSDRRQMLASSVATLCDPGASASAKTEAQNAISALELALQESEASEAALTGHLVEAHTTIGLLSIDAQRDRKDAKDAQDYIRCLNTRNVDLRADNAELADSYNAKLRELAALKQAYKRTVDAHASEIDALEAELAMSQATICTLVTKD